MAATNDAPELSRLRAALDALLERDRLRERELAILRRAVRPRGRRRFAVPLILAAFLALVPFSILAATPFTDLTGGPHDGNIDAIYTAGITTGCAPTEYCPTRNVTREEMASFLARTAGLGGNPPVANAATLQGYAPNDLIRVARALGTNIPPTDFEGIAVNPTFAALPGATVTIDAPGSGFVLVNGTVSVSSAATISVIARLRDVTPGAPSTATSPEISQFGSQGETTGPLTQTYIFPVDGAGAKSFRIELAKTGGTPRARNGVITAIFVPFGQSGGGTLGQP